MRNSRKRFILCLVLLLTATGLLTGCGAKKEESVRKIKVAVAPGFYPITYADENGNAQGYDVEVFRALDEILPQYEFEFEVADKETMNVGVQTGTYQAGINSMFKTEERKQTYAMPENNMGYTPVGLIQRSDDTINSLPEAYEQQKKCYPVAASSGIRLILEGYNEAHPDQQIAFDYRSDNNYAALFEGIQGGDYDFAVDLITVFNLQPEENVAGLKVSDPVSVIPTYPIINKEETQLAKDIDAGLKTLSDSGKLQEISQKVFGTDLFKLAEK